MVLLLPEEKESNLDFITILNDVIAKLVSYTFNEVKYIIKLKIIIKIKIIVQMCFNWY